MSNNKIQRRQFIGNVSLGTIGIAASGAFPSIENIVKKHN
jgi:hypothetical protein